MTKPFPLYDLYVQIVHCQRILQDDSYCIVNMKSSCLALSYGCSPYHRVLTWPAIGNFHHIKWNTNAAAVDSSLQLSIFAQAVGMARPFKLPLQCKTCSFPPFFKLIWERWQSGRCSSLWPLCSVPPQPLYSMFPSQLKRREKGTVVSLENTSGGFIKGILRGVRCTKSLRVLFLHRRPPSWTTLQKQYSSLMNPPDRLASSNHTRRVH